jgi:hypothetical protein
MAVSDVRQTELNTAEPLVPETSSFEVEIAAEKHCAAVMQREA